MRGIYHNAIKRFRLQEARRRENSERESIRGGRFSPDLNQDEWSVLTEKSRQPSSRSPDNSDRLADIE